MSPQNDTPEPQQVAQHPAWLSYLLVIPLAFSIILFRVCKFSRPDFEEIADIFWSAKLEDGGAQ